MEWPIVIALIIVVPVVLISVVLIWYVNIGGIIAILSKSRKSMIAKWLFDFERKGTIAWERQEDEVKQYYINQVDKIMGQIKGK
jgi:hypothetical protein